jgi:DNA-binding NtrC family response regulator
MKSTHVLLVEDDAAQANLLQRAFAEAGVLECRLAKTGIAALEVFDAYRPQVVVTDVMLPQLNGVDCARAIRERDPGVVIVGYSAVARLGREEDRRVFDAWLERGPHTEARELVALVQQVLDRKRAAG